MLNFCRVVSFFSTWDWIQSFVNGQQVLYHGATYEIYFILKHSFISLLTSALEFSCFTLQSSWDYSLVPSFTVLLCFITYYLSLADSPHVVTTIVCSFDFVGIHIWENCDTFVSVKYCYLTPSILLQITRIHSFHDYVVSYYVYVHEFLNPRIYAHIDWFYIWLLWIVLQ